MTGQELRQWREKRNLSREKLARMLDKSSAAVYAWETGRRRMPGQWLDLALRSIRTESAWQ